MNVVETFQAIEETGFLRTLSLEKQLLFVGDLEVLQYIKSFLARCPSIDRNDYYDLTNHSLKNLEKFISINTSSQAIVVASFANEQSLFVEVQQQLNSQNIKLPVVRLFADIFINLWCKQNLIQPTADELIKPKLAYGIFTTPRSGSTYFCDLLNSTGIAGYPKEHLRMAVETLTINCNFNYLRLLYNLLQHQTTENGVFGTKFISHFLFALRRTNYKFGKIFRAIDKYILLVRKDKIAQAVSLVLAQKTAVWHVQNNIPEDNPNYQAYKHKLANIDINDELFTEITAKRKFIQNQENRLRKMLGNHQIEPLEIIYEEIVTNPQLQVEKVMDYLDISFDGAIALASNVRKLPSNISTTITQQYKQHQK